MKKIVLLCATLGLKYGSIVEVGNKKGQIAEDDAKILIEEGNAKTVKEEIDGTNILLQKQAEEKDAKIAELEKSIADKDAKIADKDAKIAELEKSIAAAAKEPNK